MEFVLVYEIYMLFMFRCSILPFSLSLSLCLSVSQCFVCFAVSITVALSINNLDYAMVEAHLL